VPGPRLKRRLAAPHHSNDTADSDVPEVPGAWLEAAQQRRPSSAPYRSSFPFWV